MSERTSFSDEEIAVYRRAFEKRERQRREGRERRRQAVLTAIHKAIRAVAPSYPTLRRVYLFGSITSPGAFRPNSDIDVGVEGIDAGDWFDLWRDLEQAAPEWTLDVRLLKPGGHFSERVRQRGMVIHE